MLMHMIGKLIKDPKEDWPKHLCELVYAYNSMRSVITRYSAHILMFGCQPCLSIDFYFPMVRSTQKHQCVDHHITKLHEQLQEAFKEALMQSSSEVERQKQHYYREANGVSLEPGDLILAKSDAYRGGKR